ncbi:MULTISPECIES: hypothetical protein [Haloferax]|uniref:Uncharacterized protein n=1 Tax=Haloferax marinum TaxID=2666143 RepID=A0A6A8G796_9EURY|nr:MULTISPECIES: hypothetical protein [Haloferax]KAB1197944.1 hypothetical protein Hfx1150_10610 [Haloferax sp. CBA1150]MRW97009.1 hypothetical protein [Haloferax marinum]
MVGFSLSTFVPHELHFGYEVGKIEDRDRISEEYGIPWDAPSPPIAVQFASEQDTLQPVYPELLQTFVPGDSVRRIRESDDWFSTFTDLVDESLQNLKDDTSNDPVSELRQKQESMEEDGPFQAYGHDPKRYSPQDWIKSEIATTVAPVFRGTVEPEQVFSEEVEYRGESMTPRDGRKEVVVEKLCNNPNGRLARDIVKFEVDDCSEFFKDAWTPSLVLRRLMHSGIEPTSIEHTVEFPREAPPYEETISVLIGV